MTEKDKTPEATEQVTAKAPEKDKKPEKEKEPKAPGGLVKKVTRGYFKKGDKRYPPKTEVLVTVEEILSNPGMFRDPKDQD